VDYREITMSVILPIDRKIPAVDNKKEPVENTINE
jgi:hypothetical protein